MSHGNKPVYRLRSRPFQFSLRTMFIVMTAAAVTMSLTLAAPTVVGVICVFAWCVILPAILTVVAIYGRGYRRTFCIGALFPAILPLFGIGSFGNIYIIAMIFDGDPFDNDVISPQIAIGIILIVYFGFSLFVGLIAMGVRWMVEQSQVDPEPAANSAHPLEESEEQE